jgi:hypothetical protein
MIIRDLVNEYGVNNLRIFIIEEDDRGINPSMQTIRTEYKINPERDDPCGYHKICLTRISDAKPSSAPDWTDTIYNQRRIYTSDLNRMKNIEVYVLVDEDNKYQRIS